MVLLGIEPPRSSSASVYTSCETAVVNLAEHGYIFVKDLHYETVTIAMLVVQAKWFSAVSTSANIQSRENRYGW